VVALGVIAKVFSVAGYNISSALLILKSANILTTAIGILVSNLQFTSFAVLLFLISLYMQAEWPVRDRNEREVNVLAVSVFVCVVMVVAVAAWPLGVITLAATLSYLATRTGPLHYLGARGYLGNRVKERLRERHERMRFRRSLPRSAVNALKSADVDAALLLIENPPPYAEHELRDLARRYDPTNGVAATQRGFTRFAILILSLAVIGGLISPEPWVSSEYLTLTNGKSRAGHILGEQGDEKIILWRDTRQVEIVNKDIMRRRSICQIRKPYPTLPSLMGIAKTSSYPYCR
jgi:hypothetical protein